MTTVLEELKVKKQNYQLYGTVTPETDFVVDSLTEEIISIKQLVESVNLFKLSNTIKHFNKYNGWR